jgi:transposase-like protein
MTEHLGYEKNSIAGDNSGNSRNGHTEKTVLLENQSAAVEVPRDRNGTFEPVIVPRREKRVPLFNDQIISMHSFGMTDRDIKSHLEKIYDVEVSPDLISRVTNAVLEEVRGWQNRPLERSYPILYLDTLRIKGKQNGLYPIRYTRLSGFSTVIFIRRNIVKYRMHTDTVIVRFNVYKNRLPDFRR